ncbi:MAG: FAD-binding protein [Anaerolineales bacterium]
MEKISQSIDFASLANLLQPGQLITNPVELITYEVDASIDRGTPDGVVYPHSRDDVSRVVRWATEHDVPIIARGAGTGLSGGAVAENGGLILHFSHMNHILDLDKSGRSVVIEPGVVNQNLDEYVKQKGLYYPPDPASGRAATLGGNIAENAGGPHCFKYGVTTNYVTGLEIVLADGLAVQLGGRAFDYPEYDFTGLLTGSEGTLGIITKAYIRLLRYPPGVKTLLAAFDTVADAGDAVSALIGRSLVPAAMEFMDQKMMVIIEDFAQAGLPITAGAALIIEVDGYKNSLSAQMDEIAAALLEHKVLDIKIAQSEDEGEKIWYGRKNAAGAMARLAPAYLTLDGTVPRSKLAPTLTEINRICERYTIQVAYVFHAGDGNIHPFLLISDLSDQELMKRVHDAGYEILETCVRNKGTITGEHGVGIEKRAYMSLLYNSDELNAMREIKEVFDPRHILNPGKIFPEEQGGMGAGGMGSGGELNVNDKIVKIHIPESTEDAREIIFTCRDANQDLRIRGGGTKSSLLPEAEHALQTNQLNGIIEYALQDLYVSVGAGTPISELQAALASHNMCVPLLSPWDEATVGGIIATNFNAPLRMRYGGLRDLVLALTVVLPDGRVIQVGRPVVKNVAGYDLTKLFVGSHGTLGLITEATLKLNPMPRDRASLIVPVEDLELGLQWNHELLKVCLAASALLLCKGVEGLSDAPYTLIYTAEGLAEDVTEELLQARGVLDVGYAGRVDQNDTLSGSEVWRHWLQAGEKGSNGVQKTTSLVRVGVAPKDLPSFIKILAPSLNKSTYIADLANGMMYIQNGEDLADIRAEAHKASGYAVLLTTPEHMKETTDHWGYVPESLELMRKLKSRWDPQGLFNPGTFLV